MSEIIHVSIGMLTNLFVTLGCIFLLTRSLPILAGTSNLLRQSTLGVMFGATALASMMTAFPIADGIFGDMRNAIIAIAALTGGPFPALICAALAIAFRVSLGGQFVGAGATIVVCAFLSVSYAISPIKRTTLNNALFGIALAVLNAAVPLVGWALGLAPVAAVFSVAEAIFGSAILLYPISIVLVVRLIKGELSRLDSDNQLKAAYATVSANERRFRDVFDLSCVPMAWTDLSTRKFMRVNPEYEKFTGYSFAELEQMTFDQISVAEDLDFDLLQVRSLTDGPQSSVQGERRYLLKDGSIRWGKRTLTLSFENGQPRFALAMIEDVTSSKQAGEQIAFLAQHDHLTGLANRFQFSRNLDAALADPTSGQIAVLIIDLDDFKSVNDTRGHPVGDTVLGQLAARLQATFPEGLARIGGDEFALTLLHTDDREAMATAEDVISLIRKPFDVDGALIGVSASVGIAVAPQDGATTQQLFKKADIALYSSKGGGKGIARQFEPAMETHIVRTERLKAELLGALGRNELELEYQPIMDLGKDRIGCFEALLRWNHPQGRISPGEFIPVAEQAGFIVPIGAWVLEKACAAAVTWPADIRVAVNVSVRQFEKTLPLKVATALAASGLSPNRLEIEITESVLMQGSAESLSILHQLKMLGVRIALDDFGTGFSSLSYLQRFPFDKLKIDKSFISDGSEGKAIVAAVVQLGHSLHMRVTAEGVETITQLEQTRVTGCDEAQGFLFSKSVPANQVLGLLQTWPRQPPMASLGR